MDRYINADKFKDYIDCGHLRPSFELCFSESDVCNMIDKQPTADVVKVVRCKDCKYWHKDINAPILGVCHSGRVIKGRTECDDFCNYGEKKERVDNG